MSSFAVGFASGLPMMLAIGPIGVLLVETGLGHGFRRGWVAGVGVAAADLTFATAAALGGAALARILHRWEAPLHVVAVGVLAVVGTELVVRAIRSRSASSPTSPGAVVTRTRRQLAPRFYAMTMANPLTVAAFASLVLASGRAASSGWVVGIGVASLVVHVSLVGLGSGLGRAIGAGLQRWLRAAGGTVVLGLALVTAISR